MHTAGLTGTHNAFMLYWPCKVFDLQRFLPLQVAQQSFKQLVKQSVTFEFVTTNSLASAMLVQVQSLGFPCLMRCFMGNHHTDL